MPLDRFFQYGLWYQRQAVSDLDQRKIARVESHSKAFRTILEDDEAVYSRRLVVAAGIGAFASLPSEFQGLSGPLVSHTSEHCDLRDFAGKRVVVIGGGQSALESGVLLHEGGAEVEVVARSPHINWLGGWASKTLHQRLGKFISRFLYAPTTLGPRGLANSWHDLTYSGYCLADFKTS